MNYMKSDFQFSLPRWIEGLKLNFEQEFKEEEKMQLAIDLSALNIKHKTGGPFGAAIFDTEKNSLLSVGVNIVVPGHWACGHAEMVAFSLANSTLQTNDLSSKGSFELYSSAEPCMMCMGATIWSGVQKLVCAARHEDVQAIGFDEGPKPDVWSEKLNERGITVTRDFMRDEAVQVLNSYKKNGGNIYNASANQKQI